MVNKHMTQAGLGIRARDDILDFAGDVVATAPFGCDGKLFLMHGLDYTHAGTMHMNPYGSGHSSLTLKAAIISAAITQAKP